MSSFQAWAPPMLWGPLTSLPTWRFGGPAYTIKVNARTKSRLSSTADGELHYFGHGNVRKVAYFIVPGSVVVEAAADSLQRPKVRFRSHAVGQNVVGTVEYHTILGDENYPYGTGTMPRRTRRNSGFGGMLRGIFY